MTEKTWQDQWEEAAKKERAAFDQIDVLDLLDMLRRRQFGQYYSIWYSIAARSTLKEAGWALIDVLERRSVDALFRCHCASALIALMQTNQWQPTDVCADEAEGFAKRLREFKRDVMQQIMREG